MSDDLTARAWALIEADWFTGNEPNLRVILAASRVLPELLAEVERLKGALGRVEELAQRCLDSNTWDGRPSVVDIAFGRALRDVLRGDQ